jgi:hypothetical protein
MPVIGFLSSGSPGESASVVAAFRQGLRETGFVEGRNLAIAFRSLWLAVYRSRSQINFSAKRISRLARGTGNYCAAVYILGYSKFYDTRLAHDHDEQHDDDPAEEQIVSHHPPVQCLLADATVPEICRDDQRHDHLAQTCRERADYP